MTTQRFRCEWVWLGGDAAVADVVVVVDDEVIVAIEQGGEADVDLPGLTLPGAANAHSHAFHRALRGAPQSGTGTFWTWRQQMYRAAEALTPARYEQLATAVFAEMLLAGYTAVGEFHYLHHQADGERYDDPNAMGLALIAAAGRAGIRLTLLDTCYLHGGIGDDGELLALDDVQERFSDGDVDRWRHRVDDLRAAISAGPGDAPEGGSLVAHAVDASGVIPAHDTPDGSAAAGRHRHVRVGAAIHSVRAVDPEAMVVVNAWAAANDSPLHAHVSEQPAENHQSQVRFGATPVGVLHTAGVLGPRFTAVHATHLTDDDIALLGADGSAACFCSTTERDLADGIGPSVALAAAGVPLCIGSDSHAVVDSFEETKAIEMDARLASGHRGNHTVAALHAMRAANGYAAIGWPEGGRIEVGAPADFVTIDLRSPRTAATGDDPLATALFAAGAADVTDVVVAGRHVVRDGYHVTIDVPAALAAAVDDLGLGPS